MSIAALLHVFRFRTPRLHSGHRAPATLVPPPLDTNDWQRRRFVPRDTDQSLSATAGLWLSRLPSRARPQHLADAYPQIVNRLALCWSDRVLAERVLEELLVDKRSGRKGFTADITIELVRLHDLHEHRLADAKTGLNPEAIPSGVLAPTSR